MPLVYLFEDSHVEQLYPLTYTRAAAALRCGACTLLERVQRVLGMPVAGVLVRPELAEVTRRVVSVPVNPGVLTRDGVVLINARWLMLERPFEKLPGPDTAGLSVDAVVWIHLSAQSAGQVDFGKLTEARTLEAVLPAMQRSTATATLIDRPWDLITHTRAALLADWEARGAAQESKPMPGAHVLAAENVHIGPEVKIYPGAVLDGQAGPIMIDRGVEVRANAVITGPVHIGEGCLIRTGADIREDTCLGPQCRVGGEVIGSIFLGFGNKQHHGFVGQSIIGAWANLGAGTTTSNLKNTYGMIRMAPVGVEENTGRQFLGSVIADHAKLGIGTYLSTGSVVGLGSHVVVGRPPKFVPSFAWVTDKGGQVRVARLDFEKFLALAETVMGRRHVELTAAERELFVRVASDVAVREKAEWGE